MKPFILMTTGRAGSTALMDRLASFDDIAVPDKQIHCPDHEILHPKFMQQYATHYQQLTGLSIGDEVSLMNAFFQSNRNTPYCGFKSMPNRHRHLQALISTKTIQFITLSRKDFASTVASFIIATDAGTWRRNGGEQINCFTFGADYEHRAAGHLHYIVSSMQALQSFTDAIHINYENLCQPAFCNEQLNYFFEREIHLDNPEKPTTADGYVENWEEFNNFIDRQLKQYDLH